MPRNQQSQSEYLAISKEQQQTTIAHIGLLLKDKRSLQQSLANQLADNNANNEQLFLELLEIFDALESLTDYLTADRRTTESKIAASSDPTVRITRSLAAIQSKFLTTLARRQVRAIDLSQTQPEWQLCQIVDTQTNPAVTAPVVTKVVRQGFKIGDRLLRPVEVLVEQPPQ